MRAVGPLLTRPQAVRNYLQLRLAELEHEVFVVLFLDAQHRPIAAEEMFRTNSCANRPVSEGGSVGRAQHNATAVIFTHNHPSAVAEPSPSRADDLLTQCILRDIKVRKQPAAPSS